jgi:hypothetical protein
MQSNEQQSNEQQSNEQQVIAQLRRERDQALRERDQALCERDQALGDLSQARDKNAHTEMQWDFCQQTVHRQGDLLEARDETILELNKKLEESHDDYMCSQDAHMSKAREAEKITRELATENRDYFHRQEMLISQLAMAHREAANAREELRKERSLSHKLTSAANTSDIPSSDNINSIHTTSLPYHIKNDKATESTMPSEEEAEGDFLQSLKEHGICPRYYFKGHCRNIQKCRYPQHTRPGAI